MKNTCQYELYTPTVHTQSSDNGHTNSVVNFITWPILDNKGGTIYYNNHIVLTSMSDTVKGKV